MKKVIDMTVGSPFKNIFKFAIPIGLGFALQHLYTLGDALIVSLSLGSNAATGVNLTGTIVFFILGFAQGITAGFGIVLSQFVGAKDNQKMKQSVATSILLSLIISAVLSVVSVIIARPLLKLLKTNDLFLDYSASYLQTIFAGL
ncbi:MAG: MATE family efflux transporter, partial [Clostridia bacterium]|nr:MATE family efflux transporter [Clostridia bacterium]